MTGRKLILQNEPSLVDELCDLLAIGVSIDDACAEVGISRGSYFNWRRIALRELERLEEPGARERPTLEPFLNFLDLTNRAQARARITAVRALHTGFNTHKTVSTTNEVFRETRFRKVKNEDGKVTEQPYEYIREVEKTTITLHPPDWRAAVEFLKRRDSKNWGDKLDVDIDIFLWEIIAGLEAGEITYRQVEEKLGVADARELLISAGKAELITLETTESSED